MLQGHPEKKQRRRISDSLQVTKASHIVRIPWLIRNAGVELTTFFWLSILIFFGGIPCCCWLHFKLFPTQFNFFLLLFSSTVEAILITLAFPKLLLHLRLMTCAPTDFCWHHFLKVCPLFNRNLSCIPRTARCLRLIGLLAILLSSRKWRNPWDESRVTKSLLWVSKSTLKTVFHHIMDQIAFSVKRTFCFKETIHLPLVVAV